MTKGTIIRTVLLALALINQILQLCGMNVLPISDENLSEFISLMFTLGTSIAAWWKNNSFTKSAIEADEIMKQLKLQIKQ